ncbi:MAG: energy transducer TonB [Bryobacterales bacterium]|nr:energy transducer TonB [Bryobacterales bacterium]
MNSSWKLLRNVSAAVLVTFSFAAVSIAAEEPVRIPQPTAMSNATNKVAPSYPAVARQLRLTGDVEVDVVIGEDGRVQDAKVIKGNAVFSAATVDAVKKWSFKPIQVQGKTQTVLTTLTFSFRP